MRRHTLVLVAALASALASSSASAQGAPAASAQGAPVASVEAGGASTDEPLTNEDAPTDEEVAQELRVRAEIAAIHRGLGIATWVSMAATAVLGWIQFADEYGFHGTASETACANGDAVFQDYCVGVPVPHAIAAITTSTLYFTTFGLSFAMPAPLGRSADVELHRTLRWFHLGALIATAIFGGVTANLDVGFETRQALAIVHEGLALTTFGLLSVAAGVILF